MNENLCNNLIFLRKQRNISTVELAKILETTEDEYMEFEFGIENPTLEVLKKLGKFYGIEPADLLIFNNTYVAKKETLKGLTNYGMQKKFNYTHSIILNVVLLVLVTCFFIFAALPLVKINNSSTSIQSLSIYSLFSGDTLLVIIAILMFLLVIWDLVDNILILSCKWKDKRYLKVSKILQLITAFLFEALFIIMTVLIERTITNNLNILTEIAKTLDEVTLSISISFAYGWFMVCADVSAILFVKIFKFVETKNFE